MIDASNKKAFVAHLNPYPNGILDGVKHGILTQRSWYRFTGVVKAVTFTLGFVAFSGGFIA